jgi:hypothetical protein
MSFRDGTKSQDLGPDRLKPVPGTPILRASVEVPRKRVIDLCTVAAAPTGARERILAWLAEGVREVTWALCSLPRERWAEAPPPRLGGWPALRHARHLALRETYLTLPGVRHALGDITAEPLLSTAELDHADSAWDASGAIETAEDILQGLGDTRFELLQWLEAAPDDVWDRQLDWLMLQARQHELEHLAAIWRVALYWDRVSPAFVTGRSRDERAPGLPLHPADRLEESH